MLNLDDQNFHDFPQFYAGYDKLHFYCNFAPFHLNDQWILIQAQDIQSVEIKVSTWNVVDNGASPSIT